jgi:alpha-amylase
LERRSKIVVACASVLRQFAEGMDRRSIIAPWAVFVWMAASCQSSESEGDSSTGGESRAEGTLPTLESTTGAGSATTASGTSTTSGDPTGGDPPPAGDRAAFVHLFEWPWASVARECEEFLGPAGYAAVQVSPPQEYPADVDGSPWWDRYQPVSYEIAGRSGDRAAFQDMVRRCEAVGVQIYVDAVINHMAWSHHGLGVAGSNYVEYDYPPLYDDSHFHECRTSIQDYGNRSEVQSCELFGLPDLDTSQEYVQDQIAGYLVDLQSLGVAGFRIDAAKHIDAGELDAALSVVDGEPFVFFEVIADDAIGPDDYVTMGRVTEFGYGRELSNVVRAGELSTLSDFGESWGLVDSGDAVVFVDNHDNQRGHGNGEGVLTHGSPETYRLANVFMLAWPYGYPKVMSSYAFEDVDERPPSGDDGLLVPVHDQDGQCRQPWVCEHRWPEIAAMVGFRNRCRDAEVAAWWDDGGSAVGFARAGCGYVALNAGPEPVETSVATTLPAGEYCNELTDACDAVTVDDGGMATIVIPAGGTLAFRVAD